MSGNSFSRWAASLVSDVMARLVATWHAVFPPKSPWATSNNAGRKALDAGCYDQAEKQFISALRAAEEFGPSDGRLATSLNNLAWLYQLQARYEEAEPLHQRAMAINETTLAPDNPVVAKGLNNLGLLYLRQAKYDQAEPLLGRALEIWERTLGRAIWMLR